MTGILIGIHVFLVIILIAIILVQQPRGGGLGAFFGGGAQDLLGVRGAPTFFQKMTWGVGAAIGVLAILIAIFSKTSSPGGRQVIQRQNVFQVVPLFSEEVQQEQTPSVTPLEQDTGKTEKK
jgi:preprotein translocase subunit SecG